MKTVLFAHNKAAVEKFFTGCPAKEAAIIQVTYDRESSEALVWFGKKGIKTTIVRGNEYISGYEKEYADFIGNLNKAHSSSRWWWALNLTNKNPITTYLCNRVYYCLLISELVHTLTTDLLVVIDDDADVFHELSRNFREQTDVRLVNTIRRMDLRNRLKKMFPVAVIWQALVMVFHKCAALIMLGQGPKANSATIVVASLLYSPSFRNGTYEDIYFGPFLKHLKDRNVSFINFVWIFDSYSRMCAMIKHHGAGYNIFPKERFIAFSRIVLASVAAIRYFFVPYRAGSVHQFRGIDVSCLVSRYVRQEFTSSRFFTNLVVYYAMEGLCKRQSVKMLYYPFENRSFEKMIILATRGISPKTRIIGYQHASISLRHTNFILAEGEAVLTPLPDRIMTMGEITRDIMRVVGRFPEHLLSTGCAFRQSFYSERPKARRGQLTNLFVALATGIDEYVKVFRFLDDAFSEKSGYAIWIRPHPVFSLDEAIRIAGGVSFRFHKADRESLDECYRWADMVLYVHSTLSIEAIRRGIPAVNLGIDDILNPDPMFNFDAFKWRVDRHEDLIPTIRGIAAMDKPEFEARQRKGVEFAKRYIAQPSAECVERFLNA